MTTALFIGFSTLSFLLIVFAFVDCAAHRPRSWFLWLLFILLGFVPVSLDLATGKIGVELLSVLILGAKVMRSGTGGDATWIIGFSAPVGAILWLARSKPWARPHRQRQCTAPDCRSGLF